MQTTVFLNCGWMELYNGHGDIFGGGSYVEEHGKGHEMFNFKNFNGKVYGYAQPSNGGNNHIERLGASYDDDSIDGVLAVFIATHPQYGGLYVTGWYHNAIFYREYQDIHISGRKIGREWIGYFLETDYKNAKLLTPDERIGFIELPSRLPSGSGWKGRSNVWYADKGRGFELKQQVIKCIEEYEKRNKRSSFPNRRLPPPIELKNKVEKVAMECVTNYYKEMKYTVTDKSKNNLGWDLEAYKGKHIVRIEVKGLSGMEISVDLTRNEYAKMREYKDNGYRLAVVTNALSKPTPYIFEFSKERNAWIDPRYSELPLRIDESIFARCSVIGGCILLHICTSIFQAQDSQF